MLSLNFFFDEANMGFNLNRNFVENFSKIEALLKRLIRIGIKGDSWIQNLIVLWALNVELSGKITGLEILPVILRLLLICIIVRNSMVLGLLMKLGWLLKLFGHVFLNDFVWDFDFGNHALHLIGCFYGADMLWSLCISYLTLTAYFMEFLASCL